MPPVAKLRRLVFRSVLLALALATFGLAHPVPYSYLDLRLAPERLTGDLIVHVIDLAHDLNLSPAEILLDPATAESKKTEIFELLRSRLSIDAGGQRTSIEFERIETLPDRQAVKIYFHIPLSKPPGVLKINASLFPYDPQHQTFLNIYDGGSLVHQEIFDRSRTQFEYFTGGRQGVLAVIKKFIPGGVYHIFTGPDHILFIIGLLLMGGSMLRLLSIVTAFTIAHSITLSLTALNLLSPPERIIEPAIALSIVYVGIDNLMVDKSSRDVRIWIAFFFGLIHGFGFASVLREFGLPPEALGWSLFSFNFGVEIGQAVIVIIAASLLGALRSRRELLAKRVAVVGSVIVILAGSYWFIQRIFF
jgi:hydrogenase/urease accessory protein HupE